LGDIEMHFKDGVKHFVVDVEDQIFEVRKYPGCCGRFRLSRMRFSYPMLKVKTVVDSIQEAYNNRCKEM